MRFNTFAFKINFKMMLRLEYMRVKNIVSKNKYKRWRRTAQHNTNHARSQVLHRKNENVEEKKI